MILAREAIDWKVGMSEDILGIDDRVLTISEFGRLPNWFSGLRGETVVDAGVVTTVRIGVERVSKLDCGFDQFLVLSCEE